MLVAVICYKKGFSVSYDESVNELLLVFRGWMEMLLEDVFCFRLGIIVLGTVLFTDGKL